MSEQQNSPTFEQSLAELERIVDTMEQGDLSLDEALSHFERGVKLAKESQRTLEQAEQKVKILLNEQDNSQLADFTNNEN